jgi:hypothetical protein
MHKRLMAMAAVLALGVAAVLWVSANPQEKASVKPAVVKSGGSCCAHEGAAKTTAAPAKSDIKPAAVKEGKGECPYMAGMLKATASNGKENCANCPAMKTTAKTAAVPHDGKACKECPAMQSSRVATQAKAVSAQTKKPAEELEAKR